MIRYYFFIFFFFFFFFFVHFGEENDAVLLDVRRRTLVRLLAAIRVVFWVSVGSLLGRSFVVASSVCRLSVPHRWRRGGRRGANGRDWIPSRLGVGITCTALGVLRANTDKRSLPVLSTWVPSLWQSWFGRSWYQQDRTRILMPDCLFSRYHYRTVAEGFWYGRKCSDKSQEARDRRVTF